MAEPDAAPTSAVPTSATSVSMGPASAIPAAAVSDAATPPDAKLPPVKGDGSAPAVAPAPTAAPSSVVAAGAVSSAAIPSGAAPPSASALAPDSRPRLSPGVRLREDPQRGWVLLAPERVVECQGPTAEILRRCDASRTLAAVVDELALAFAAPRDVIEADVSALLSDLLAKKLVRL